MINVCVIVNCTRVSRLASLSNQGHWVLSFSISCPSTPPKSTAKEQNLYISILPPGERTGMEEHILLTIPRIYIALTAILLPQKSPVEHGRPVVLPEGWRAPLAREPGLAGDSPTCPGLTDQLCSSCPGPAELSQDTIVRPLCRCFSSGIPLLPLFVTLQLACPLVLSGRLSKKITPLSICGSKLMLKQGSV